MKSLTSTAGVTGQAQDVVVKRKGGGQPGNKNRFRNGRFSQRNCAFRRDIAELKRTIRGTLLLAEATRKLRDPV